MPCETWVPGLLEPCLPLEELLTDESEEAKAQWKAAQEQRTTGDPSRTVEMLVRQAAAEARVAIAGTNIDIARYVLLDLAGREAGILALQFGTILVFTEGLPGERTVLDPPQQEAVVDYLTEHAIEAGISTFARGRATMAMIWIAASPVATDVARSKAIAFLEARTEDIDENIRTSASHALSQIK